jgi:hypothetical protein
VTVCVNDIVVVEDVVCGDELSAELHMSGLFERNRRVLTAARSDIPSSVSGDVVEC